MFQQDIQECTSETLHHILDTNNRQNQLKSLLRFTQLLFTMQQRIHIAMLNLLETLVTTHASPLGRYFYYQLKNNLIAVHYTIRMVAPVIPKELWIKLSESPTSLPHYTQKTWCQFALIFQGPHLLLYLYSMRTITDQIFKGHFIPLVILTVLNTTGSLQHTNKSCHQRWMLVNALSS